MQRLADKTAIVIGGGQGLGEATCRLFKAERADVVVADINADSGERVARAVDASFVRVDLADAKSILSMMEAAIELLGHIDIVVNTAAVFHACALVDMADEEYQRVMAINLDGAFYVTRAAARHMLPRQSGSIINVASIGASSGTALLSAYCASKAGILGLTRAAALELAPHGIRVNSVSPGAMLTGIDGYEFADEEAELLNGFQPRSTAAEADEVAAAILFLASDEASFVIGQDMIVDGGATCGRPRGTSWQSDWIGLKSGRE